MHGGAWLEWRIMCQQVPGDMSPQNLVTIQHIQHICCIRNPTSSHVQSFALSGWLLLIMGSNFRKSHSELDCNVKIVWFREVRQAASHTALPYLVMQVLNLMRQLFPHPSSNLRFNIDA